MPGRKRALLTLDGPEILEREVVTLLLSATGRCRPAPSPLPDTTKSVVIMGVACSDSWSTNVPVDTLITSRGCWA